MFRVIISLLKAMSNINKTISIEVDGIKITKIIGENDFLNKLEEAVEKTVKKEKREGDVLDITDIVKNDASVRMYSLNKDKPKETRPGIVEILETILSYKERMKEGKKINENVSYTNQTTENNSNDIQTTDLQIPPKNFKESELNDKTQSVQLNDISTENVNQNTQYNNPSEIQNINPDNSQHNDNNDGEHTNPYDVQYKKETYKYLGDIEENNLIYLPDRFDFSDTHKLNDPTLYEKDFYNTEFFNDNLINNEIIFSDSEMESNKEESLFYKNKNKKKEKKVIKNTNNYQILFYIFLTLSAFIPPIVIVIVFYCLRQRRRENQRKS